MRSVRSLLIAVVAGFGGLLVGAVGPAAGAVRLPGVPTTRLLLPAQLPDGLGAAVTHAAAATAPAAGAQTPQLELQAQDGLPGDGFGYSVQLNAPGNAAVIGAPARNGMEGAAYVFVRQGGAWVQQAELVPSDGAAGDNFGWSVSINALGNEVLIGAYNHNASEGAAYVFVHQGAAWVQQAELQPSDGQSGDGFGVSVWLNALGNEAIAGAPSHNAAEGAAYVFLQRGGGWVQEAELVPSDGASGDGFGYSVALDALGEEALVGSPEHNGLNGAAYVFAQRGGGWVQQQELVASNGAPGDLFGISVALDAVGSEAIAGAIGHNGVVGAAYVFVRQGGGWVQQAELVPSDGTPGDGFGISVALNALGDRTIVGAYAQNAGEGAAYVFARQGGAWIQRYELQPADGAPQDVFGYAVSLDAVGGEALVGAPRHDAIKGAAYVFPDL
jgi:FG-GAP repeat